jgi:hypothetical protein
VGVDELDLDLFGALNAARILLAMVFMVGQLLVPLNLMMGYLSR